MIKLFADWLAYSIFNITPKTLLAEAVDFFIYDTIKIFLLLVIIIFSISIIRSFLPPEKIRNILSSEKKYFGNVLASLLGIITPFCTCSAIPLFLGFLEAGVPLGTTFSFLVASPMINEVALVLLFGMFGLKIALLYIISGLIIAILSGIIVGHLKVEKLVEEFIYKSNQNGKLLLPSLTWKERIKYARDYTIGIINKVWLYIILGIGIGAWIHGYVPTELLIQYAGNGTWYSVPLAVLIGIPLYSNAAGIIPLVGVLTEKGISTGTSLAFMMAVTGLSLPEFMILKKVMKTKLILIFAGIVGLGIVFTGYLFNVIIR
jgi:uncharacterized protein